MRHSFKGASSIFGRLFDAIKHLVSQITKDLLNELSRTILIRGGLITTNLSTLHAISEITPFVPKLFPSERRLWCEQKSIGERVA